MYTSVRRVSGHANLYSRRSSLADYVAFASPSSSYYSNSDGSSSATDPRRSSRQLLGAPRIAERSSGSSSGAEGAKFTSGLALTVIKRRLSQVGPPPAAVRRMSGGSRRSSSLQQLLYGDQELDEQLMLDIWDDLMQGFASNAQAAPPLQGAAPDLGLDSTMLQEDLAGADDAAGGCSQADDEGSQAGEMLSAMSFGGDSGLLEADAAAVTQREEAVLQAVQASRRQGSALMAAAEVAGTAAG